MIRTASFLYLAPSLRSSGDRRVPVFALMALSLLTISRTFPSWLMFFSDSSNILEGIPPSSSFLVRWRSSDANDASTMWNSSSPEYSASLPSKIEALSWVGVTGKWLAPPTMQSSARSSTTAFRVGEIPLGVMTCTYSVLAVASVSNNWMIESLIWTKLLYRRGGINRRTSAGSLS